MWAGGGVKELRHTGAPVVNIHAYIEKKRAQKKRRPLAGPNHRSVFFKKNGGRSGAAIINPTACSVFFKGQSRFRKFLFPDLVPKQSRKDPLNDFLKQSGARSAPGIFCSIWAPEAAKT